MKKFKFRYEQLLKIRIKKVDDLKHQLGEQNFRLKSLEDKKQQKLGEQSDYFEAINELLTEGCSSQQLIMLNQQKGYYERILLSLENDMREVKLKIIQIRDQLNEALKDQKIMEKLKEKEESRYFEEIEAAETKVTEEIVNYTNYKGREE